MKNLLRRLLARANMLPVVLMLLLSGVSTQILAFSNYLSDFNANYNTQGTRIDNCGLCHYNFNGGGPRTPYGEDFRNNNFSVPSVGSLDSDGDGQTNDQEAAGLTYPGLSCSNLISTQNAPAGIADFVDPNNPGCVGVGSPPIVNMNGPYVGVTGSPISFSSAGSTDPDGTIVSYLWNFGSGYGTSTEANPTFTYTLTFQAKILVTLTVTDNDGNTSNSSTFVTVLQTPNSPPVADAGAPVTGVVNSPVQFDGSASSDPENGFLSYRWDFGDGTIGGLVSPTHSYNRCGTYNVSLTVSDNATLTNTASTTATIASSGVDLPVAHAGGGVPRLYDGQVGTNVPFDGSGSFDPDCNIVTYSWNFGDGTSGTGMSPLHSYSVAGDYVVTLTVTDNDGLQAIDVATVSVIDTGPLNGEALYQTNCATCHGAGANSTKIGATVARINSGISTVAAMNSLSTMTATEVQAISDYLVSLTPPPPPPGPVDGATLYDTNCATCHGAGANSTKIGATVARIDAGITSVPAMNSLSTLTATEVQAISDYLVSLTPPPPGPVDGATLYDTNCAACHGAGANSTKIGATVARIDAGITSVPAMSSLSTLTATEVQAISDYLVSLTPPPPPPGPVDGATLYDTNCATCHGAGANSTKIGATVARIDAGITSVPAMSSLSTLTATEVQAISDYLVSLTPPPPPPGPVDGATLYDTNCATCHGAGANSTKIGATVARIDAGITSVPAMNSLSTLTATEVQAISDYLVSLTPPPPGPVDGATLYDTNCAACHGAGANSTKIGATVARIDAGITSVPAMSSLSTLTATEVQAISDYLVSLTPPPPPPGPVDGAALYDTNCAGCHGLGDSSAKVGATVTRINDGIANVPSMNGLSTLSTVEIQAISDYLVSLTPPPPPPPGPVDGATLYDTNCAGCHGPGDSSAKAGATAARINNGIASVPSMSGLSSLSAADIDAIAAFLSAAPAPTTPQGLYVANCGSCHGVDGSGGITGEDVRGDSASKISEAIKDESEMQSLSFLSAQEIQLISDFLNGITSPPPGGGSGEAIYAANCASCHGAGATSAKSGATVARINNGIANVPSMNGLSSLSAADIQAVSDYLVSLAPTPPPGTGNGETLYSTNCAGCHGPGGSSAKAGATVARINNGIASVPSMSSLSSLSAADVEAIAAFLSSAPAPTTPQELYVANCGSCHGADGSGGITGEDVRGDSASKISEAIQKESEMQILSFLSSEEIQLISDFLNGIDTAPPGGGSGGGDGLTLYANNCAGCHGPGDSSAKAGATAARINSGIASVPSMSGLSSLTAAEVDAIAAYLSTAAPPTTPEGLYAANCGSCHGADGSGGITDKDVRGDSAGKISEAIQDESEMRFLGFLSRSELQLIAEYLGSSQSASNDGD